MDQDDLTVQKRGSAAFTPRPIPKFPVAVKLCPSGLTSWAPLESSYPPRADLPRDMSRGVLPQPYTLPISWRLETYGGRKASFLCGGEMASLQTINATTIFIQ